MKTLALLAISLKLICCTTTTTTTPDGTKTVTRSIDLPALQTGAGVINNIVDSNRGK